MPVSPTVRRRRLTGELRRLRAAANRTIEDVADAIGVSNSALSRMESGQVGVRLPVLRALLSEYGVSGPQAMAMEQLSREASQRGWWQNTGGAMLDATKTLIGLEEEAKWENDFSLTAFSGLLQTRPYAEALIKAGLPEAPAEAIREGVDVRIRRQERLGDLHLWTVIAEEALLRPIGGTGVMREQIENLIVSSSRPRITIQVLGREIREHPGMGGPFTILGLDPAQQLKAVYVEGNRWDACLEDPNDVEYYQRAFDVLRAMALSPEDSVKRLAVIAKGFKNDE